MTTRKAPKRVYLYRAAFSKNAPQGTTLQDLLTAVLGKLPKAGNKPDLNQTVQNSAQHGQLRINHHAVQGGVLELKIVALAPGEFASTVPISLTPAAASEGAAQPPPQNAFKGGDFFLIVSGNNIIGVGDHLRLGPVETYLRVLLMEKLPHAPHAAAFEIKPVARKSKLQQLKNEGIREIKLNTTLYAATLDEDEDSSGLLGALMSAAGGVRETIGAILKKDQSTEMNEHLGDVQVSLSISVAGASRGPAIAQMAVEDIGLSLVSDGEFVGDEHMEPVLITKRGNRVSASESTTSEVFHMNRRQNENSLNDTEAWATLRTYYGTLKKAGALDE